MVSEWSAYCTRHNDPELVSRTPIRSRPKDRCHPTATRYDPRRTGPIYAWTDLTYLLHAGGRVVGLLRRAPARNPTARAAASRARPIAQDAQTPGDLEPAAVLRHGARRPSTRQHPTGQQTSSARCDTTRCPRSRGSCRRGRSSEHPPAPISAGVAYVTEPHQRRHAQPRVELDRDLPGVGRLGRLLRPRRATQSSTRTATACACPAS